MSNTIVGHLIRKDLRVQRAPLLLSLGGGVIALAILQIGGETATVLGSVWFFVALIILASILPVSNIVNERKKQNLPFLMSLPVSPVQYTMAKVASTIGLFLIPWLILVAVALWLIFGRGILPHGVIPVTLILCALPLIGFVFMFGTALVSESEGWTIAASIVCNSSYGLTWYFMTKVPALTHDLSSKIVVWNSTLFSVIAAEYGLIALILALTFFLQSRKRDFI